MRYAGVVVALFGALLFGSQSRAVELEDCSKFWLTKADCLEKNVILLNSAFEKVAAELRRTVQDLNAAVNELKNAGFLVSGDKVQLSTNRQLRFNFQDDKNKCIDKVSPFFPDGNQDFVLAAPCTNDAEQRWTISR